MVSRLCFIYVIFWLVAVLVRSIFLRDANYHMFYESRVCRGQYNRAQRPNVRPCQNSTVSTVQLQWKRYYPMGRLTSHVVGYRAKVKLSFKYRGED